MSLTRKMFAFALLLLVSATPVVSDVRSLRVANIVVDFDFAEVRFRGDGYTRVYPAVLPSPRAQQHVKAGPVHGTITRVDFQPTWRPTPRMRRNDSELPEAVRYGEPGHPLGPYRIRVSWDVSNIRFWQYVHIHGGAKEEDLYLSLSSGCIRLLDAHVTELVSLLANYDVVHVTFGHGLILADVSR